MRQENQTSDQDENTETSRTYTFKDPDAEAFGNDLLDVLENHNPSPQSFYTAAEMFLEQYNKHPKSVNASISFDEDAEEPWDETRDEDDVEPFELKRLRKALAKFGSRRAETQLNAIEHVTNEIFTELEPAQIHYLADLLISGVEDAQ